MGVLVDFFQNFNPIIQSLIATLFTWGMTALRAYIHIANKNSKPKIIR